jgi:hypothetical protein
MKSILFSCLLLGILLLTNVVHAEGECPPGMFPTNPPGAQGPVGCAPIPGYNQQQGQQQEPQSPPPRWTSRWGAIAGDESPQHGSTGASVNQPTRAAAEQAALENCKSNGGLTCKIEATYDNECVALVVGHPKANIFTDSTQERATEGAMHSCSSQGNTDCHVYYTACSLPARIQ